MSSDPMDCAYFAGLLDGEGSISCSNPADGPCLFVVIGMNDRTALDWVADKFGGIVYTLKDGYTHQWVSAPEMRKSVLEAVLPYLKVKHRQAELGIAFCDTVRPRVNRKALTVKELLIKQMIASKLWELNSGRPR